MFCDKDVYPGQLCVSDRVVLFVVSVVHDIDTFGDSRYLLTKLMIWKGDMRCFVHKRLMTQSTFTDPWWFKENDVQRMCSSRYN